MQSSYLIDARSEMSCNAKTNNFFFFFFVVENLTVTSGAADENLKKKNDQSAGGREQSSGHYRWQLRSIMLPRKAKYTGSTKRQHDKKYREKLAATGEASGLKAFSVRK